MSNLIGEAYVVVRPDTSTFRQETQTEVTAAVAQAQQTAAQVAATPTAGGQSQAAVKDLQALQAAANAANAVLQTTLATSGKVSDEFLVGAASEEEAAAAATAYAKAGLVAARANAELAVAMGLPIAQADREVLALERANVALDEHGRHAQRFRQQARLVAEGEASLGSLLGPASLLKFGLGAIAFGAVITTLSHLEESLKVTGAEAFTFEGRLRNVAGALLHGDLIEAIGAITAQAPSAREELKKLIETEGTTSVDLRNFAQKQEESAATLEKVADSYRNTADTVTKSSARQLQASKESSDGNEALSRSFAVAQGANQRYQPSVDGVTASLDKQAESQRQVAQDARDMANALETSVTAAQDVEAAMKAAGSEAAVFGEQVRGAGAVAAAQPSAAAGQNKPFDATNTFETQLAIDQAKADTAGTLRAQLVVAQEREKQARIFQQNQKDVVEGAKDRERAVAEAHARVATIEREIAAQEKAAREAAKAAAERAAREAQAAREAAARAYAQQVANDVQAAKIAADTAGHTGKAEKDLLAILKQSANDRKLTQQARLGYLGDLRNEQQAAAAAIAASRQSDIDYRKSVLELAIQRAEVLTPNDLSDDKLWINREIKFLEGLRDKAKKMGKAGRDAVVQYESEILGLKAKLQGLVGSGITTEDLFQEAVRQFQTFGSNVAGRGGPLSPQDVRGQFAGNILAQLNDKNLTAMYEQTTLLEQIAQNTGRRDGQPDAGRAKIPPLPGSFGTAWTRVTELAADNWYGSN